MGRYIDWDDITDRYSVLTKGNYAGSAEVDSAHIVYAENELDALLASTFTVPFSSNNLTAKDLSIDLTYCRVGNFKISERKEFKEEIMEKINMLKNGEMSMITDSGDVLTTTGTTQAWSSTEDYHPVFGLGNEIQFQADSSRIIDEENDRGYFY